MNDQIYQYDLNPLLPMEIEQLHFSLLTHPKDIGYQQWKNGKLIILNLPHPRALTRELANNPEQQQNSQYARDFQQEGAHLTLRPERLTRWVTDPEAMPHYIEAFKKSDFEAMLNIYKANYPREPYVADSSPVVKVQCPVLMIHGLKDRALLPGALNDTWDWLEKDLTLVTIPDSEHFVQQDAADLVTRTMRMWLNR